METLTAEATQLAGEKFAEKLLNFWESSKARVAVLYGDLGSGKTTFIQGMAKGLGIKKRIISPTFLIVRNYKMKKSKVKSQNYNSKFKSFYHVDLYRTQDEGDLEGLGLKEILEDPQNIVAIEWGEKLGKLMPKKRCDVKLEYLNEDKRRITIDEQY